MVQVPPEQPVTFQDLVVWDEMKKQLETLRNAEMVLRMRLFKHFFPEPVEGTNKYNLAAGYVLNGQRKIDRKLDEPVFLQMSDEFVRRGFNPNLLVRRKLELALAAYRELTAEQQKFFDQALIIKDGAPSMEIVLPAKNKPKEPK